MTENLSLFLRGLLIGISIAAPVGPIGILCIRRTLAEGKLKGFLSGMGAASADMAYGSIAAFGLTVITNVLMDNTFWFHLIGGFFLIYLGVKTFLEKPANHAAQTSQSGYFGAYISTFLLTITNLMTIFHLPRSLRTISLGSTGSPILLVAGVFAGSAAWWLALSFGVSLMRDHITQNLMLWINRASGLIIFTFGFFALIS
ncbi:MAG: LysE family transporter [Anaerolineales bacterium]|nr:LysE family transporter [Anaerolineales bacterium]